MLRKVVFVLAVGCALVFAQDANNGNAETSPLPLSNEFGVSGILPNQYSTSANPIKPTSAPDTNSTSVKPITTPAPYINTTIAPPVNTTTAPSSTSAPHTNTTISPSTQAPSTEPHINTTISPSTIAPSTEPPIPSTTLPPPSKGHYYVKVLNDTCIIADLAVQVKLVVDNKTSEFDVPNTVNFTGTCTNVTQNLNLTWEGLDGKYGLTFQFAKNESTNRFMVSTLNLTVPQLNDTLTNNKPLFTASVSKSYRCEKEQEIKLQEKENNDTYAILKVSHLQLEAFNTKDDGKFSAAEDCAGPYSPDIVPIAVGCALVGLIAIVLIAYLVGRRRSQARGYLSM